MEALGGIGYLENEESQHINVARLYRDANVLSIWEGTSNVLGADFIKILKGRNGERTLQTLDRWVQHALFITGASGNEFATEKERLVVVLQSLKFKVQMNELDELLMDARELMESFAIIVTGTLMIVDAERDNDAVSVELCRRFAREYDLAEPTKPHWRDRAAWDSRIVFGEVEDSRTSKARL